MIRAAGQAVGPERALGYPMETPEQRLASASTEHEENVGDLVRLEPPVVESWA